MEVENVYAVYFSPTKGTKTYVTRIAEKLSEDFKEIDLTVPGNRKKIYEFGENDLVVVGGPVYAGRLPGVDGGIFQCLRGNQTPAVLNVSYGNREIDDALLELKNILESNGFVSIGAGEWIAPHTFSEKIGAGRPDREDYEKADEFAAILTDTLEKESWKTSKLEVPGHFPYCEEKRIPFYPTADENCTNCKKCVEVCPVEAVSVKAPAQTDTGKCIACLACVKACPVGSRQVRVPAFGPSKMQLEERLTVVEKKPVIYTLG